MKRFRKLMLVGAALVGLNAAWAIYNTAQADAPKPCNKGCSCSADADCTGTGTCVCFPNPFCDTGGACIKA